MHYCESWIAVFIFTKANSGRLIANMITYREILGTITYHGTSMHNHRMLYTELAADIDPYCNLHVCT